MITLTKNDIYFKDGAMIPRGTQVESGRSLIYMEKNLLEKACLKDGLAVGDRLGQKRTLVLWEGRVRIVLNRVSVGMEP